MASIMADRLLPAPRNAPYTDCCAPVKHRLYTANPHEFYGVAAHGFVASQKALHQRPGRQIARPPHQQ
jgi:hypothetical protein